MIRPTHIADAIAQVLKALRGGVIYPAGADPKPRPRPPMSRPIPPVAPRQVDTTISHPREAIHLLSTLTDARTVCGQPVYEVFNWSNDPERATCRDCLTRIEKLPPR